MVDDLRGDIGTVPFSKNRHPHIHWINFWDEGDIVSGSIETSTNKKLAHMRVDNIHGNSYIFPSAACHSGYFESRGVIEKIFCAIFDGAYIFTEAPIVEGKGRDYGSMVLGPGKFRLLPRLLMTLASLLPWLILLGTWLMLNGCDVSSHFALSGAALVAGLLALSWLISIAKGHLDPLYSMGEIEGQGDQKRSALDMGQKLRNAKPSDNGSATVFDVI